MEIQVHKIFDDGRYNSFTDLAFWQGHYYVTFRSGVSHAGTPETPSEIVVIRSADLETWEEVARFGPPPHDLRDPKLLPLAGELRVYGFAIAYRRLTGGEWFRAGLISYGSRSEDGLDWEPLREFCPSYAFWRPRFHEGTFYVAAYQARDQLEFVDLLCSADGWDWRPYGAVAGPEEAPEGTFTPSETDLLFLPDGHALLFVRRDRGRPGFGRHKILRSRRPDLGEWELLDESLHLEAHASLWHEGSIYFAGRLGRSAEGPEVCALYRFDPEQGCEPIAEFPCGGDTSYPGLIALGPDELAVSYYSTHEGRASHDGSPGQSNIYLARVKL